MRHFRPTEHCPPVMARTLRRQATRSWLTAALLTAACAQVSEAPPAQLSAGLEAPPAFAFTGRRLVCKLINEAGLWDDTANRTHARSAVAGTDLGLSFSLHGVLFLLFGDTMATTGPFRVGSGADPDSVAVALGGPGELREHPERLCDGLRFLNEPGSARFAPVRLQAPPGEPLSRYVRSPPPGRPELPGTFEVPSGVVTHGDDAFVFYTSAEKTGFGPLMTGSFLARWSDPTRASRPDLAIVTAVDDVRARPLGGHFIQVAPVSFRGFVYLYGTGDYRSSDVYLARVPLGGLERLEGLEQFDARAGTWGAPRADAAPVVATRAGELSVRYFPELDTFVLLHQTERPGTGGFDVGWNRVEARFSRSPEGPFSAPVVLHDMTDPRYRAEVCCQGERCEGGRAIHCERAGAYAPYLLPSVRVAGGRFTLFYTLSTWDPYGVVLMEASFDGLPAPAVPAAAFWPIAPRRLLDTRLTLEPLGGERRGRPLDDGELASLDVAGALGVHDDEAIAAVVTVTATGADGAGFVSLFPAGAAAPPTSNVNYRPGDTVANSAIVPLRRGRLQLRNLGARAHVLVDVAGLLGPLGRAGGSRFVGLSPARRLLDTRQSPAAVTPGAGVTLDVGALTSSERWPGDAAGLVVNLTAAQPAADGFLSAQPAGTHAEVSSLNFLAGSTRAALGVVGLSGGRLELTTSAATHVLVDAVGAFVPAGAQGTAGALQPIVPVRVYDAREAGASGWLEAWRPRSVSLLPAGVAPGTVSHVVANVTVTQATGDGWLSAGDVSGATSSLNFEAGRDVANLAFISVDAAGTAPLLTAGGAPFVVVDVQALVLAR